MRERERADQWVRGSEQTQSIATVDAWDGRMGEGEGDGGGGTEWEREGGSE